MAKNSPVALTKYHPAAVPSLALPSFPSVAVTASIVTVDAWASVVVAAFGNGFFGTPFFTYGPYLKVVSHVVSVFPFISEQNISCLTKAS